mmetsp:Transcript_241/g.546  ORF Transcript_241/g.546 Transcript_241/m.546 type:complete len:273 (-) Transcript_241:1633-2451(-)
MWTNERFSFFTTLFLIVKVGMRIGNVESFGSRKILLHNRLGKISEECRQREPRYCNVKVTFTGNPPSRSTRLFSSENKNKNNGIRFLGKGSNAIVRPGVILLAPAEEFHHYLRESAVFIYAMGTDDNDDYVIRGAILDNPTPFTIGEMMENKASGGVYENLIFRGGESGGQEAFCLHSVDSLGLEEIGTSRIYQGGELDKIEDPSKVKFFFNYMEFLEQELEDMLEVIQEDGDGWTSVEVPPEMVLDSDYDKGEAWSILRNAIWSKRNGISN